MIKRWKRYFVIYWKIQLQNIKSLEQYRADFFMMLFFTTLSQACNLSVIGIIYSNIPSVGGWNMWEILILYGYILFSEGSVNFFFQGAWKITQMLNKAEIDRFLVRPLPVGLQLITAKIDFDGLNKMFLASVIFFLGFSHCRINWRAVKVLYFVITLVIACIIRFCMIWIASCTSFWLGGIKNSLNYFTLTIGEMAKYPLTIYPAVLNMVFAYIIPYAFISYFPASYLLGKSGCLWQNLMIPAVCGIMLFIAGQVLRRGLRRYESNGN